PAAATRLAYFDGELLDVPVRSRASLVEGPQSGPLLVDEYDTTVVVPPGWSVALDEATGAILLEFLTPLFTRRRSRCVWLRTHSRRRPTRWRRPCSAPRTPPSCATRWTSRPRSAGRPARRSHRR